jgi:hypothetical protein
MVGCCPGMCKALHANEVILRGRVGTFLSFYDGWNATDYEKRIRYCPWCGAKISQAKLRGK